MASETWRPKVDDEVKCIDNGYTNCEEKPYAGQHGRVVAEYKEEGEAVTVIQFYATKRNVVKKTASGEARMTFNEYICQSRGMYNFFEPVAKVRERTDAAV